MGPDFALALARSQARGQGGRKQEDRIMSLGPSGRPNDPLHVIAMALALVLAAFLGAALGLVWQSAGFGGGDEAVAAQKAAG
jgi:hypothetical protein